MAPLLDRASGPDIDDLQIERPAVAEGVEIPAVSDPRSGTLETEDDAADQRLGVQRVIGALPRGMDEREPLELGGSFR